MHICVYLLNVLCIWVCLKMTTGQFAIENGDSERDGMGYPIFKQTQTIQFFPAWDCCLFCWCGAHFFWLSLHHQGLRMVSDIPLFWSNSQFLFLDQLGVTNLHLRDGFTPPVVERMVRDCCFNPKKIFNGQKQIQSYCPMSPSQPEARLWTACLCLGRWISLRFL